MSGPYSRSIFAYSLSRIISPKKLQDLSRVPVSLEPRRVNPLADSLNSLRRLPGLNPGEIMSIVIGLQLSDDERLQIYAALIALGVQRLLLEYLADDRAWLVAEEVRVAALLWLRQQRGKDPFRRIRGLGVIQEPIAQSVGDSLEDALDSYDEGITLSTLGYFHIGGDNGHALLRQAHVCFERAQETLTLLPQSMHEGEDWQYWYNEVRQELAQVEEELA